MDDAVFHARRRGRRWKLDPAWLFRRAYLEKRSCAAIAAETGHPTRRVVEMIRRLSDCLERRLLVALALPSDILAAAVAGPVREDIREHVLKALRTLVGEEEGPEGSRIA